MTSQLDIEFGVKNGEAVFDPIVVDVINCDLDVVASDVYQLQDTPTITVTPGRYLIRGRLPSGEWMSAQTSVAPGSSSKVVLTPVLSSPGEDVTQGYIGTRSPRENANASLSACTELLLGEHVPGSVSYRLWRHGIGHIWTEVAQGTVGPDPGAHVEMRLPHENPQGLGDIHSDPSWFGSNPQWVNQYWLALHGDWFAPRFIPLPMTMRQCRVLLRFVQGEGGNYDPLQVIVSTHNAIVEALLKLITSCDYAAARTIWHSSLGQTELLFNEEIRDPLAAAVGGYFLLLADDLPKTHGWSSNLDNRFPALPDGAVIHAWHLLRTQGDLDLARDRLIAAATRGLPFYTCGLRLLVDGLMLFMEQMDARAEPEKLNELRNAWEFVSRYAVAADWTQPTTTAFGDAPALPRPCSVSVAFEFATHQAIHRYSIEQPEAFWGEQAKLIDWHKPFTEVLDFSNPPFAKWFVGGETNLCYNAIDRHATKRPNDRALVFISTETDQEVVYSFAELKKEVMRMAAIMQSLGVSKGDRVLIYMPMVAEAMFAMLACTRIGAIHSVVFGGFASGSLATRIDDATPKLIVSSDAGMRGGRAVPYKDLLDEAIRLAKHQPAKVLMIDRGLDKDFNKVEGRDVDYATLRTQFIDAEVPITWLESSEPSYILYTSGTTGKPKGVQRDTGGYAVALASTLKYIFCGGERETFFATSDIGWVVGHSYIVYGPLIGGMCTIMYEGTPLRPDPGIWWQIVEKYKVNVMFSAPTAARVLKKHENSYIHKYDLSSLKHLFLAGEPLDQPTHEWIMTELGLPVYDNYWQTETGWPILGPMPGVEKTEIRYGTPNFPIYGYNLKIFREDGTICDPDEKGIVGILPPLPPGCLTTVWGDDARFVSTYFTLFREPQVYSSFDWGIADKDGYHYILGRTDDVINVAGHRLGTREIEEAIQGHPAIAEVAVVGVPDERKGQTPIAFVVVKNLDRVSTPERAAALEMDIMKRVQDAMGTVARPSRVHFLTVLPKTRSGMLLRRSIQALAEGRNVGELTTVEVSTRPEQKIMRLSDS